MSTRVPLVLSGLIDDAVLLRPCSRVGVRDAFLAHRRHVDSWYASLVGPFLLPVSRLTEVLAMGETRDLGTVGIVGDVGVGVRGTRNAVDALAALRARTPVTCLEIPVAMRRDDPLPGVRAVIEAEATIHETAENLSVYAEVPLTGGVLASLDLIGQARDGGANVAPKFRIGGLAAELFPSPVELAAVICACRDRSLPFKITTDGNRAMRRTDPETGLVNHGFLNILAATCQAHRGVEPADLVELLATTDVSVVIDVVRVALKTKRPLWHGISGCGDVVESVNDLRVIGLLPA